MGKQTYDNYHRAYWQRNKEHIRKRTAEYRKAYAKKYYAKKKAERLNHNISTDVEVKNPEAQEVTITKESEVQV